MARIKQTARR